MNRNHWICVMLLFLLWMPTGQAKHAPFSVDKDKLLLLSNNTGSEKVTIKNRTDRELTIAVSLEPSSDYTQMLQLTDAESQRELASPIILGPAGSDREALSMVVSLLFPWLFPSRTSLTLRFFSNFAHHEVNVVLNVIDVMGLPAVASTDEWTVRAYRRKVDWLPNFMQPFTCAKKLGYVSSGDYCLYNNILPDVIPGGANTIDPISLYSVVQGKTLASGRLEKQGRNSVFVFNIPAPSPVGSFTGSTARLLGTSTEPLALTFVVKDHVAPAFFTLLLGVLFGLIVNFLIKLSIPLLNLKIRASALRNNYSALQFEPNSYSIVADYSRLVEVLLNDLSHHVEELTDKSKKDYEEQIKILEKVPTQWAEFCKTHSEFCTYVDSIDSMICSDFVPPPENYSKDCTPVVISDLRKIKIGYKLTVNSLKPQLSLLQAAGDVAQKVMQWHTDARRAISEYESIEKDNITDEQKKAAHRLRDTLWMQSGESLAADWRDYAKKVDNDLRELRILNGASNEAIDSEVDRLKSLDDIPEGFGEVSSFGEPSRIDATNKLQVYYFRRKPVWFIFIFISWLFAGWIIFGESIISIFDNLNYYIYAFVARLVLFILLIIAIPIAFCLQIIFNSSLIVVVVAAYRFSKRIINRLCAWNGSNCQKIWRDFLLISAMCTVVMVVLLTGLGEIYIKNAEFGNVWNYVQCLLWGFATGAVTVLLSDVMKLARVSLKGRSRKPLDFT